MRVKRQSGFSMIEVLISVLILALGAIGAAGLHIAVLRSNQQSSSQSMAVQIVSEMADAMRANATWMNKSDAANPYLAEYKASEGKPTVDKNCIVSSCTTEEMAKFDVYEWKRKIYDKLPGGRGKICRDATPWDGSNKALTWDCTPFETMSTKGAPLVIKLGWQLKGKKPDGSYLDEDATAPPVIAITVQSYVK